MRTCVGCRRRADPGELVRIVWSGPDRLAVGRGMTGRGAWLCKSSEDCLDRAVKGRRFGPALRAEVTPEAVSRLRSELLAGGGTATGSGEIEDPHGCGRM